MNLPEPWRFSTFVLFIFGWFIPLGLANALRNAELVVLATMFCAFGITWFIVAALFALNEMSKLK